VTLAVPSLLRDRRCRKRNESQPQALPTTQLQRRTGPSGVNRPRSGRPMSGRSSQDRRAGREDRVRVRPAFGFGAGRPSLSRILHPIRRVNGSDPLSEPGRAVSLRCDRIFTSFQGEELVRGMLGVNSAALSADGRPLPGRLLGGIPIREEWSS
jgi:hypothetical protein